VELRGCNQPDPGAGQVHKWIRQDFGVAGGKF
jgi:hypothetical protein